MSSRPSKDEKEFRSGRDRSRSRSPNQRDDYSKKRQKDYDRRGVSKKDNDYKKKEDDYKTKEEKYGNSYRKQEYDNKQQEDHYTKPGNNHPKLLKQNVSAFNEEKKTSFSLVPKTKLKSMSIQMKIGGNSNKPKLNVAAAFSQDSDDEPDQMPPEARMRMKNIGRNTPTSSGPNSFGKTKQGFSDAKKVFERNLKEAMDAARADD